MPHRPPTRTDAVLVLALVALAGVAAAEGPKAPAATSEPVRLTIKWSTSSEVDNYGFWIMRGDSESGPFKEANAKMIPGAGNSDLPKKYAFDDVNVEMGKTYYYYLDAISTKGAREKYSPVMAKQCCDTAASKAPEAHEIKPDEKKPEPVASPTPKP